ncbi:hypothetical protein MAPG_04880 [Magnaporthiopsis poae ATCC 64411]|uniref:Uncharacterized protein n=1 Tax=Magnaporthiopsis poae (strain ATCC 64411 / 73-15) TaxID=644358 RepID=A0A0C4DXX3_MAGP6|nr:hypothetical protein MAPG_04880 [Magnaporthiopsis poae ATCC 64411]
MAENLPKTLDDALEGRADWMSVPHLLAHVKALASDREAQAKYLKKDPSMRLDKERLETFLPQIRYPDHWNKATRDAFKEEWKDGPSKAEVDDLSPKCTQMLTEVWKVVCMVFRCLPTDLLSPRRGRRLLYGGTGSVGSKNGLLGEGESVGRGSQAQPTTVWKPAFGRALMAAVCCPAWENEPDIFVMALQYVIICNTRDKRKWVIGDGDGDPTGTDFVKALMRAIEEKADGESIPEVHRRILQNEPRLERSSISKLFKRTERLSARVKIQRPRNSSFYWVTQKDLEILEEAANTGFGGRFATGHLNYWYIKKSAGYGLPKQHQLQEYLLAGTRQLLIDVWVNEEEAGGGGDERMQDVDAGEPSQGGEAAQEESDDEVRPKRRAGLPHRPSAPAGGRSLPLQRARRRRRSVVDDSEAEDSSPERPVRRQRTEAEDDDDAEAGEDRPRRSLRLQRTAVVHVDGGDDEDDEDDEDDGDEETEETEEAEADETGGGDKAGEADEAGVVDETEEADEGMAFFEDGMGDEMPPAPRHIDAPASDHAAENEVEEEAAGQSTAGQEADVQEATGQADPSQEPTGQTAAGQEADVQAAPGQAAAGEETAANEAVGGPDGRVAEEDARAS